MGNNWKIYNQQKLIDILLDEFDELAWVEDKVRMGKGKDTYRYPMSYLVYFCKKVYFGYYKHKSWDEYTSVSYKTLQKWFGRDYHKTTNILLDYTETWSHSDSTTRGWKLNDKTQKVFDEYFSKIIRQKKTNKIVGLDGKILKTMPKRGIISSSDNDGKRLRKEEKMEYNISSVVGVNYSNIENCIDIIREWKDYHTIGKENNISDIKKLLNNKEEHLTDRRNILQDLIIIANSELLMKGKMYQHYYEGKTGRLQATGSTTLQRMPGELRRIVLGGIGYWDYDIENCHYTLLKHLSNYYRYGKLDSVEEYLKNKKQIRKRLSLLIDEEVDVIKKVLVSILYGSSRVVREGNKVTDMIGSKKQHELNNDPFVSQLYEDTKNITNHILDITKKEPRKHPYLRIRGNNIKLYENIRNKRVPIIDTEGKSKTKKSVMSFILQGMESKILDVCLGECGNQIKVLLHDGFIIDGYYDKKKLIKSVKDSLDIDVEFSSKPLEIVINKCKKIDSLSK